MNVVQVLSDLGSLNSCARQRRRRTRPYNLIRKLIVIEAALPLRKVLKQDRGVAWVLSDGVVFIKLECFIPLIGFGLLRISGCLLWRLERWLQTKLGFSNQLGLVGDSFEQLLPRASLAVPMAAVEVPKALVTLRSKYNR